MKPEPEVNVTNYKNYKEDPEKYLLEVLKACLWENQGSGYWSKARSMFYVDDIGVFLYRYLDEMEVYLDGEFQHRLYKKQWVRTHGLAYPEIRHLPELYIKFLDDFKLDLLTGEPLGQSALKKPRVIPTVSQ